MEKGELCLSFCGMVKDRVEVRKLYAVVGRGLPLESLWAVDLPSAHQWVCQEGW
jgi:hypothetical protein